MFEIPAAMLSFFYGLTGNSLIIAIALMSVVVMAITTPLTLKSTKGMLEMQKISPEMRRLQNEHRNDKQKLNEEMMKLYQEHKVNPMSSCLPIFAQMPVFIVMFRILRGLTYSPRGNADAVADVALDATGGTGEFVGFIPRYLARDSELFQAVYRETEIRELGLDLAQSPFEAIQANPFTGIIYALLVVVLGALYFGQQRMVAARAAVSPTMSPTQQKVMQYLPVVFAVFQIFFLTALVVYYIFQTLLRILQQYYITKKFYGGDESLGRQAQRAGEAAREESKDNGEPQGLFAQAKRDLKGGLPSGDDDDEQGSKKPGSKKPPSKKSKAAPSGPSKRVTPPKGRPTASPESGSSSGKGRPTMSRKEALEAKSRPTKKSARPSGDSPGGKKSGGKKKR